MTARSRLDQLNKEQSMRMPTYARKLVPGMPAPPFEAETVTGSRWKLGSSTQAKLTLLIFYRGSFCSYCRRNLEDFDAHARKFADRGVDVVFASADDQGRARFAVENWNVNKLRICYGVTTGQMQAWGLYMSAGDGAMKQAAVFSEPGLFLVKNDMTLLYEVLNSAPFGRPSASDMIAMLDFMESKGSAFPQRGGWLDQKV
jgi:peroxiredoxin